MHLISDSGDFCCSLTGSTRVSVADTSRDKVGVSAAISDTIRTRCTFNAIPALSIST